MTVLLVGGGDGYKKEMQEPFMQYLERYGFKCIWFPLLEEQGTVSYDDLEIDNYCKYIDSFVPKNCKNLWCYGISKSCDWLRKYASKRSIVKKLILVEDTVMKPDLLVEFEKDRGNDWIQQLYEDSDEHEELSNGEKALDAIVSDNKSYIPKCPIRIIWTTKNNENQPYDSNVLRMKRQFVSYLKNKNHNVKVTLIDSDHCADLHRQNFELLKKIILS